MQHCIRCAMSNAYTFSSPFQLVSGLHLLFIREPYTSAFRFLKAFIMPQCKATVTLQHLCISSIANNLSFWTQNYEETLLDKGRFRHLLGPFDEIPSELMYINSH